MPVCAILSFRLGLTDGVSVVAETWARVLDQLGWQVVTVAGEGPVDRLVAGLELGADRAPDRSDLSSALIDADLVLVENLLTIPMNLTASRMVAAELAGRPALLHHHDPPWQRKRFSHITELPPDDPQWRHVTINQRTQAEFAERGLTATTIYNGFDTSQPAGDRDSTRRNLGVSADEKLLLHPVRAIERKNVPEAIAIAERFDATYWLPGPAEDGYEDELNVLLDAATCRVLTQPINAGSGLNMADAYAASDLVLFPSTWEGFGNPPIEAALAMRPVVVGDYPIADELRSLGFDWLRTEDHDRIGQALTQPSTASLKQNRSVVEHYLSLEILQKSIETFLDEAGWTV